MRRRLWFSVVVLVVLGSLLVAGCGGGYKPHAPRPPLPKGQTVLTCGPGDNHTMGECLPRPKKQLSLRQVSIPGGIRCVDLSNNDPVFGVGAFRAMRAHGIRCLIVKLSEGVGFFDGTAGRMVHDARAAGLVVGGYGFQHVCLDSATGEALLFVRAYRLAGLGGHNATPPQADVEFGNGRCGSARWESAWRGTVARLLGRSPGTYTGAWFWNPAFGAWWPSNSTAWISGFGVPRPFMPIGRSHLDLWQFTDSGCNGVSCADESVWLDGSAAFNKFANSVIPRPKQIRCFGRVRPVKVCVATWTRARNSSARAAKVARTRKLHRLFEQRVRFFSRRIRTAPH